MSTEIAKRTPLQEVCETIASEQFKAPLRPSFKTADELDAFISVALVAVQENPALITADRRTLYLGLRKCAQDGLVPDGREAALVIMGSKVSYMPMIFGLRKKAAENGFSLSAYTVHEEDTFAYALGLEPSVTHLPPDIREERGDVVGAYAVAKDRATGEFFLDVMNRADIEKVRAVSRAATSPHGPWINWYEEQCKKTVARRLYKTLPFGDAPDIGRVIESHDAEYDLPEPEPRMTVEEANLNASLMAGVPVDDGGPDDVLEGEALTEPDEPHGPSEGLDSSPMPSATREGAEPSGSLSAEQTELTFAEQAEAAQRKRAARGAAE